MKSVKKSQTFKILRHNNLINKGGIIMVDIEKIDDELYTSIYGKPKKGNSHEIWSKIVSNPEILR